LRVVLASECRVHVSRDAAANPSALLVTHTGIKSSLAGALAVLLPGAGSFAQ